MAVYSVEGKLGTGKTKFAVWRAQEALLAGRRVASNVDLNLDKLTPRKKTNYVRLPDKPKASDLDAAGHGNPESYDEDKNGVMILDELGTWLNSRSFQDKERAPLLDWFIHARKHGWDVYLIVQDANMIDKQVREAMIEYRVKCMRGDKIKLPFIGGLLGTFNKKWGYLPKFHMAVARVGEGQNAVVAERWLYRGLDLHAAYDTRQIFRPDYPHGSYSVIYPAEIPDLTPKWLKAIKRCLAPKTKPQPKPPRPEIAQLMTLPPDERIREWKRLGLSHC